MQPRRVRPGAHRQRGLGLFGWMFVLAVLGAVATVVFPLSPPHLNDRTVGSVFESWAAEQDLRRTTPAVARKELKRLFSMNGVELELREVLSMERTESATRIVIDYEVRTPIVANVDAISHFHHEWTQDH